MKCAHKNNKGHCKKYHSDSNSVFSVMYFGVNNDKPFCGETWRRLCDHYTPESRGTKFVREQLTMIDRNHRREKCNHLILRHI